MTSVAIVLFLALQASEPLQHVAVRDPRTQPLTREDALFVIPGVTGPVRLVEDMNGDGKPDLIAECGGHAWFVKEEETPKRIDAVSALDGRVIRTLWTASENGATGLCWDTGGDIDRDGIPDLLVGLPFEDGIVEDGGSVLLISGASGIVVREVRGQEAQEHLGFGVAFLGDLNLDGSDDYVVSAPGSNPYSLGAALAETTGDSSLRIGNETRHFVHLADGSRMPRREFWNRSMAARSSKPGTVSAHSGSSGKELWRRVGSRPGHAFGFQVRAVGDLALDGARDLVITSGPHSGALPEIVSGLTGTRLAEFDAAGDRVGSTGDLDGDRVQELFVERMSDTRYFNGIISIYSFAEDKTLFELKGPDWFSKYSRTVSLGDIDGDGVPDFMLGEPDFHIRGLGDPGLPLAEDIPDLRTLTLADALALETGPWCAMTWESGTAWVYSGRTREVILGAWGAPGSRDGMGIHGTAIPDLTSDGCPELLIVGSNAAYVFPGPGAVPLGSSETAGD